MSFLSQFVPFASYTSTPLPMQYLGLHPFVFKNTATKAFGYVQSAHQLATSLGFFQSSSGPSTPTSSGAPRLAGAIAAPPSPSSAKGASPWSKWAAPAAYTLGGLVLGGAAAGTAYMRRDDLGLGYTWATDHMRYVGTLWDEARMKQRVEELKEICDGGAGGVKEKDKGVKVLFRKCVIHVCSCLLKLNMSVQPEIVSTHSSLPPRPPILTPARLRSSPPLNLTSHRCSSHSLCQQPTMSPKMRSKRTRACSRRVRTMGIMRWAWTLQRS